MSSDSEYTASSDSENGIRFKTDSTRDRKSRKRKSNEYKTNSCRIGPALPPHLIKDKIKDIEEKYNSTSEDSGSEIDLYGPTLPPKLNKLEDLEKDSYGPALPSTSKKEPKVIGPSIPEHVLEQLRNNEMNSEDEDDEVIGPLPEGAPQASRAQYELEKRAIELKLSKLDGANKANTDDSNVREEWMLELPKINSIAGMGLVARQFRTKERPDFSDRSSWTDTPKDKEEKVKNIDKPKEKDLQEEKILVQIARKNAEQKAIIKKHKKKHKRDESLLDIHEKKLRKQRKKEEKERQKNNMQPIRRPFDRDIDLKANSFDEAKKKAALKKAQLLDTKFSSGKSKFL